MGFLHLGCDSSPDIVHVVRYPASRGNMLGLGTICGLGPGIWNLGMIIWSLDGYCVVISEGIFSTGRIA